MLYNGAKGSILSIGLRKHFFGSENTYFCSERTCPGSERTL